MCAGISLEYRLKKVRVVQYGVGPIGAELSKYALKKSGLQFVGAVDIDPKKVGKDLGEVVGGPKIGVPISNDSKKLLAKTTPDLVLHSTGSYLKDVKPQLLEIMKSGADIVSTCEELSYPYLKNPTIARELNRAALRNKITLLGTGVNPGFVMDALVLTATGVCQEVKSVKSSRIQDASTRRLPFQKKIGAGLTQEDFRSKVADGTIKHVGFQESIAMIASGLGWKLERIDEVVEPKLADSPVSSEYLKVEIGQVAGVNQTATGIVDGRPLIVLNLQAYLGCPDPRERIVIEGQPRIDLTIKGGVHGDIATASVIVNSIPRVLNSKPGLVTMKDLPIPSGWFGDVQHFIVPSR
jgi:4-hydroxy-tetrahydrodipicolinate reductase